MVTFRPKEKPLLRRLLSNVAVQILFISAIVFSVFLIVRHQQRIQIAARVADLERAEPTEVIQRTMTPQPTRRALAPKVQPTAVAAVATNPTATPIAPAEANETRLSTRPAAAAVATTESSDATPVASSSIRVSFNEVPRPILNELTAEAAGSYGGIQYGVVPDWTQRSRLARSAVNWRSLDSTTPQSIKVGETTTVHRGPRNETSGDEYGIWVYTKLVRVEDASITLQLELSRVLPNPNATGGVDQFNRLPLPEITVPRGAAVFVTGLVPHRPVPLSPTEVRLYRNDRVLQILTSEPFRGQLTDLAIFVEPVQPGLAPSPPPTSESGR